jgi:hypothetical protein
MNTSQLSGKEICDRISIHHVFSSGNTVPQTLPLTSAHVQISVPSSLILSRHWQLPQEPVYAAREPLIAGI